MCFFFQVLLVSDYMYGSFIILIYSLLFILSYKEYTDPHFTKDMSLSRHFWGKTHSSFCSLEVCNFVICVFWMPQDGATHTLKE